MNKEAIGRYIVERRDTLMVSQREVAKLAGISVHTLSNLETGTGNVTIETLMKVASILGLKISIGV